MDLGLLQHLDVAAVLDPLPVTIRFHVNRVCLFSRDSMNSYKDCSLNLQNFLLASNPKYPIKSDTIPDIIWNESAFNSNECVAYPATILVKKKLIVKHSIRIREVRFPKHCLAILLSLRWSSRLLQLTQNNLLRIQKCKYGHYLPVKYLLSFRLDLCWQ